MGRSSKPVVALLPHALVQIKRFQGKDEPSETEHDQNEDIESFNYGLVIGQMPKSSSDQNSKKDDHSFPMSYIVYFARTPVEVKENEDGEDQDEEEEEEIQNLQQVDPEWVMEHAKQVSVMLPGGIRVLGVFFADQQNSEEALKSGIVEKCLQKIDSVLNVDKKPSNYLAVHINKKNASHACDLFSFVDGSASKGRKTSTDLEETGSDFRWQVVTSKFLFDYPIIFRSGEESENPISKKVKFALKMVEKNLDTSNILLDNTFRSKSDEFLDVKLLQKERKKSKSSKKVRHDDDDDDDDEDEGEVKEYAAEILLDPEFQTAPDDVEILDVSSRMRLSGRMAIRAYLHPRATVGEAIEAVKEDLLRSLNARCDMHCDSLVGEEIGGAGDEVPVLHEPPRRVLIKLPNSEIAVSDFLFPGESTEASAKSFVEMFGFVPELEDLDDEQELVASPKQVVSGDGEDKMSAAPTAKTLPKAAISSPFSTLSIILSLVAIGLGIALSYFYSMGSGNEEGEEDIFAEETVVPPKGRKD